MLFGRVRLSVDRAGGIVHVDGDAIPAGVLVRQGPSTRTDVPIGTRHAERLSLTLGGAMLPILPASGSWSRRTYRVVVERPGNPWLFTAATPTEHRLVRGDSYRGGNEIGMFCETDGVVTAQWSQQVRVRKRVVVDASPATAEDCALGYLLAGAFGTGARLLGPALVAGMVNGPFPG